MNRRHALVQEQAMREEHHANMALYERQREAEEAMR